MELLCFFGRFREYGKPLIQALGGGESETQLRLLAEQLCRRVESKYERVWEERMERERNDTERRLAQINRAASRDRETLAKQVGR